MCGHCNLFFVWQSAGAVKCFARARSDDLGKTNILSLDERRMGQGGGREVEACGRTREAMTTKLAARARKTTSVARELYRLSGRCGAAKCDTLYVHRGLVCVCVSVHGGCAGLLVT